MEVTNPEGDKNMMNAGKSPRNFVAYESLRDLGNSSKRAVDTA